MDFDFGVAPFDRLNAAQQALVRATAEQVALEPGDPLLTPEMEPTHAFLIVQGRVRREAATLPEAVFGPGELLGARAVLAQRASSVAVALDAVAGCLARPGRKRLSAAQTQAVIKARLKVRHAP